MAHERIPNNQPLGWAIAHGEFEDTKRIIEEQGIDVNSCNGTGSWSPIMMNIYSFTPMNTEEALMPWVKYFLEKGGNPNLYSQSGYNSMHLALDRGYMQIVDLYLDHGADVNLPDSYGWTPLARAIKNIYKAERDLRVPLLEKMLQKGAWLSLNEQKRYEIDQYEGWTIYRGDYIHQLIERYAALKPEYTPSFVLEPKFGDTLAYKEAAQTIWDTLVPKVGRARTVQGELMRAVEKLRDEAQRNDNMYYTAGTRSLANFVSEELINSELFDKKQVAKIKSTCKKMTVASRPYLEDEGYDYLKDRICEFYTKTPGLIPMDADDDGNGQKPQYWKYYAGDMSDRDAVLRYVWKTCVPKKGGASTLQGELLSAVERLRWECQDNKGKYWNDRFAKKAEFIRTSLLADEHLDDANKAEVNTAVDTIIAAKGGYAADDMYDKLCDYVYMFYKNHPEAIAFVGYEGYV